jgi:hypothetical protein
MERRRLSNAKPRKIGDATAMRDAVIVVAVLCPLLIIAAALIVHLLYRDWPQQGVPQCCA